MAKSIRSKVKKRLRTVKRGVVKRELLDRESKLGKRTVELEAKLDEALAGHIKPGVGLKNAFRSDDPDATIPQHSWRQGPDFRSGFVPDAGYACVGSNRPKLGRFGGDAPTARPTPKPGEDSMQVSAVFYNNEEGGPSFREDGGVGRLLRNTEQIVPQHASKKTKKRLKAKVGTEDAAFRWT